MNIALYAVIFGILIAMTLMGFRKGFLKTIVSMSALIISLVFVYFFSEPITTFLDTNTSIRQVANDKIYESLSKDAQENYAETASEQKQVVKDSFIPNSLVEEFEKTVDPMKLVDDYITGLSSFVAGRVVCIAGFLLTLAVAFITIKAVTLATHLISKVPLVGGVNRILGGLLGFARGVIIVWLIFFLLTVFSSASFGANALAVIKGSKVLSVFYDGALSFAQILKIF